ncbi:uncharacterized protein VTP21DRAFT_4339 [Calcarisporiella thermophila]|uniref:uncharacterized protein n=1 Tax=Calcarisporiella thermophila TaxID=911321 RepID=UPI003743EA53
MSHSAMSYIILCYFSNKNGAGLGMKTNSEVRVLSSTTQMPEFEVCVSCLHFNSGFKLNSVLRNHHVKVSDGSAMLKRS